MLEVVARRVAAGDLPAIGTSPAQAEATIHRDTVVRDEEGRPLLVVASLGTEAREAARAALRAYQPGRGSTVLRAGGVRNRATTFGYLGRSAAMRRYGCRACDGARKRPEAHAAVTSLAGTLAALGREVLPDQADADMEAAGAVDAEWRLAGSPWTSGVVNWNSAMPYHYDRNNLPAWSAMVCVREGMRGGHLHIPGLDLTVACHDGDVVWFPGWALMHGVTPLEPQRADARRLTAVFYALKGLTACLEPEPELIRARARRTEAEDNWKERQAAQGLLLATPERATDIAVAIPSHQRPQMLNERSLRLLADRGVPKASVKVFVAADEVEEYRAVLDPGLCTDVLPGMKGQREQLNFIASIYPEGTRLVHLDDDISDVRLRVDDKRTAPAPDLVALFEAAFDAADAEGETLWGLYPVLNPMFMKDRIAVGLYFCLGQVWGAVNTHEPHGQLEHPVKTDYERTLRWHRAKGSIVRLDFAATKSRMYAPGGLQAPGQPDRREANERVVDALIGEYPGLVKVAARTSPKIGRELRLTGAGKGRFLPRPPALSVVSA